MLVGWRGIVRLLVFSFKISFLASCMVRRREEPMFVFGDDALRIYVINLFFCEMPVVLFLSLILVVDNATFSAMFNNGHAGMKNDWCY